ncbi:hypothetical protein V6N11_049351 [Hibiscus sabdariffa]|uniref:Uncharacterized protein n=1 Tax=Hibiscus sabdariffa TaxID=183260 RepID=A0ABR2P0E8_9ROSI
MTTLLQQKPYQNIRPPPQNYLHRYQNLPSFVIEDKLFTSLVFDANIERWYALAGKKIQLAAAQHRLSRS